MSTKKEKTTKIKEKKIRTEDVKAMFQALACIIDCSSTNEEICEVIGLLEKYGGSMMTKWQTYSRMGKFNNTREEAISDFKRICTLTLGKTLK